MDNSLKDLRTRLESKRLGLLFAAESGSRALGFHSPDSDYDIRFVFIKNTSSYLALYDNLQDIQYKQGELDYAGWDLKKTLTLALKSNPSLIEWLNSPILYVDKYSFKSKLKEIVVDNFSSRSLAHHYINFMRNIRGKYLSDFVGEYTMKRYFYALRPIFCIMWMEENSYKIPPVIFSELLNINISKDILNEVNILRQLKSESREVGGYNSPILNKFIEDWFNTGHDRVENFPQKSMSIDPLNSLFIEMLTAYEEEIRNEQKS